MKKKVILLLVLALCLTGCGKNQEHQAPVRTETAAATAAPETIPDTAADTAAVPETAARDDDQPAVQVLTEPPAEANGTIHVDYLEQAGESFGIINEVWMGENSVDLALWSDGLVRNVVLEYGPVDPESGEFLAAAQLYNNEALDSNTLVKLHVDLRQGETCMRVTYEGKQGVEQYYVIQRGEQGRILLREALADPGGQAPGGLHAARADEVDPSEFTIRRSCDVDADGQEVYLYSSGSIRNFRLDLGTPDSSGVNFRIERNLCTLEKLNEGEAVKLTAVFPDGQPNLRVTYENDMGIEEYYVTQSGENGSILLILTY